MGLNFTKCQWMNLQCGIFIVSYGKRWVTWFLAHLDKSSEKAIAVTLALMSAKASMSAPGLDVLVKVF